MSGVPEPRSRTRTRAAGNRVGFAVAGGESRRMGRDKALLGWADTDLLGHALARLAAVTGDVRILAGSRPRYLDRGLPVHLDPRPGEGPLGGLLAALEAIDGRIGLLLAVDLPFVPIALLSRLLDAAHEADAVVPLSTRGPEPLCAAYGAACLPAIRACVRRGDLRMTSFWPEIRLRTLGADALADLGDPDALFRNLNTPEDYTRAGH